MVKACSYCTDQFAESELTLVPGTNTLICPICTTVKESISAQLTFIFPNMIRTKYSWQFLRGEYVDENGHVCGQCPSIVTPDIRQGLHNQIGVGYVAAVSYRSTLPSPIFRKFHLDMQAVSTPIPFIIYFSQTPSAMMVQYITKDSDRDAFLGWVSTNFEYILTEIDI